MRVLCTKILSRSIGLILVAICCALYVAIFMRAPITYNVANIRVAAEAKIYVARNAKRANHFIWPNGFDADKMAKIFEERLNVIKNACAMRHGKLTPAVKKEMLLSRLKSNYAIRSTFYVDEKNKLLVSVIAKVGSTNWKRLLIYLSGRSGVFRSIEDVNATIVHDVSRWPSDISLKTLLKVPRYKSKIDEYLNYTKILWVRHPMTRLASAWHSKLRTGEAYYEDIFGRHIVRKYRQNVTEEELNSTAIRKTVTLEEFFNFLSTEIRPNVMHDVHWSTFAVQAMPCFIDYDYVGKLENWYPEARLIFDRHVEQKKMGKDFIKKIDSLNDIFQKSATARDDLWRAELRKLPSDLLGNIRNLFSFDFQLFSYK